MLGGPLLVLLLEKKELFPHPRQLEEVEMAKTVAVPRYYLDACSLLAMIDGEPIGKTVEAVLVEATEGKIEVFTSVVSITEVAFSKIEQDKKKLSPEAEAKINKLWEPPSPVKLVDVHELISKNARELIRDAVEKGLSLKPMDAIHLVTAQQMSVTEFYTLDKKLPKFTTVVGFKILEPHSQPSLFDKC